MTRLPSMTASDVIKRLKKCGFVFDRYAKGSHEIWGSVKSSVDRVCCKFSVDGCLNS